MGCWDTFCFLCGNTYHTPFNNLKNQIIEIIDYCETNKKNKFLDIYKNYKKNPTKMLDNATDVIKTSKWLNNCTFLSANGEINHNCKEIACNITFQDNKGNIYTNQTYFESIESNYGLFVHTDCWKFVKKEYKIKLSYKYLPINKVDITENKIFKFINYGKIEKYWQQEFDFIKMISDGNKELCTSPLKSKIVANNIKKVFSKLKIRKDESRQSPPVSATFYKEGIYRIGNNNNIWFIKNGKWNELKNTVSIEINNLKKIKNISYLADINIQPIFIKSIDKKFIIITTDDIKNKL